VGSDTLQANGFIIFWAKLIEFTSRTDLGTNASYMSGTWIENSAKEHVDSKTVNSYPGHVIHFLEGYKHHLVFYAVMQFVALLCLLH
jgi:hypothetical protein